MGFRLIYCACATLLGFSVSAAKICPGLTSPYATPLSALTSKPEYISDAHLLDLTINVGAREDELSLFVAAAAVIAYEDLLLQPSKLTVISEEQRPDAFAVPLADVIPADVNAAYGISGLDVAEVAAAGGRSLAVDHTSKRMGSLGHLYSIGIYAPPYTVANITAMFASSGFKLPVDAGYEMSEGAIVMEALKNQSIAALVGNTIQVLQRHDSLAAALLCDNTDPFEQFTVINARNVSFQPRTLRDGTVIPNTTYIAAAPDKPATTSILTAMGLANTISCARSSQTVPEFEAMLHGWLASGRHFLVLGWSSWPLLSPLLRLPLPAYDAAQLLYTRRSELSRLYTVPKTAHRRFQDSFHISAVGFLQKIKFNNNEAVSFLRSSRDGAFLRHVNASFAERIPLPALLANATGFDTAIEALPGLNVQGLLQAACLWTQMHAKDVLRWGNRMRANFVTPSTGPTGGFFTLKVIGAGFGFAPPVLVSIAIGGQVCLKSRWVNDNILECVAPPFTGLNLAVDVLVGKQQVAIESAFSYFPAIVRNVASVDASRSQYAGTDVVITGSNFFPSDQMLCKFAGGYHGEGIVKATFINFTTITCQPPTSFNGLLTLSVSNDGIRWSTGLTMYEQALRFPSGGSSPPLDFGPTFAPRNVRIAFLNPDVFDAQTVYYHEFVANETVKRLRAGGLLPYTDVSVVTYLTTMPAVSAPDQSDAGAARLAAGFYAEQVAVYNRIRQQNADLIGIVGGYQSIVTIPVADAVMNATSAWRPVMTVSYGSTDPVLSSIVEYPYFLRVVPSDTEQGNALAHLLHELQPKLIRSRAIPANLSAPNVYAVVASDSSVAVAAFTAFRQELASVGGAVEKIGYVLSRDSAVTMHTKLTAAGLFTYPPSTYILSVFAPSDSISRVVQSGQANGLTGTSKNARLWLGVDTFAAAAELYPSIMGTTAGFAVRPAIGSYGKLNPLNSTVAAFIADSVTAILAPFDSLVKQTKNASLAAYPAAALSSAIRSFAFTDTYTDFGRFSGASNDPSTAVFEVVNTLALAASGLSPFITADEVRQVVGSVSSSTPPSLDKAKRLVLSDGREKDFVPPSTVTVVVPWPVPPQVAREGLDGYKQITNYSMTWRARTETRQSLNVTVAIDMLPLFRGMPIDVANMTLDSILLGTIPNTSVVTTPSPLLLVDPDDSLNYLGDQFQIYHPSSGLLAGLEYFVEQVSADPHALAGANVALVLVPYLIDVTAGLNAHTHLQPALFEALTTLHVNNTPNVIGILGMHSTAGTNAVLNAMKFYPDKTIASLPVVSYGASTSGLSHPAVYPNFVRSIPPAFADAIALVDICRRYRWSSIGVIFSGLDDPIFDGADAGNGVDLYTAFSSEARAHGINILGAVNISNYLSLSHVPQFPLHSSKATSATPASFVTEREAGLFLEMLRLRLAGARVIVVLSGRRSLCPILRTGWAARLFKEAPYISLSSDLVSPSDFISGMTRMSSLRDNKEIVAAETGLDYTNPNVTAADKAANLRTNSSFALGPDGRYYVRSLAAEAFTWLFASATAQAVIAASCVSQVTPDPWATYYAIQRSEIQQFGRPPILESDGNIRRAFYDGYDKLAGTQISSGLLLGSLGITPAPGDLFENTAMMGRIVARNRLDVSNATSWLLTQAARANVVGSGGNLTKLDILAQISTWRQTYGRQESTSQELLRPVSSLRSADAATTTTRPIVASPSQFEVNTTVYHARNALQMLLVAAAGAISDGQNVSDSAVMMSYLRGRIPQSGAVTNTALVAERPVVQLARNRNDPLNPAFAIVNRQGPGANTIARVGTLHDRGYVRFTGCPVGSEPNGEFACRPCPVNSYKSGSGSEACLSCPLAGGSSSRMITNGKTGASSIDDCLCPIGFHVRAAPLDPNDQGTICMPCTAAMQCSSVHLPLTNLKNAPGFWRGDPKSSVFIKCVNPARCNASDFTVARKLTRSFEASYINGTACTQGSEGPLCGVCKIGYGEDPRTGMCVQCPPMQQVVMSVLFACFVAVVLVCLLAAVQVSVSGSYFSWRRVNNTKLLLNFLQINAVLLTLNLQWPQAVKQFFNLSQLSATVNLSWISWDCLLRTNSWPVSFQVFVMYMGAPVVLVALCTILVLLLREIALKCGGGDTSVAVAGVLPVAAKSAIKSGGPQARAGCCKRKVASANPGSTVTMMSPGSAEDGGDEASSAMKSATRFNADAASTPRERNVDVDKMTQKTPPSPNDTDAKDAPSRLLQRRKSAAKLTPLDIKDVLRKGVADLPSGLTTDPPPTKLSRAKTPRPLSRASHSASESDHYAPSGSDTEGYLSSADEGRLQQEKVPIEDRGIFTMRSRPSRRRGCSIKNSFTCDICCATATIGLFVLYPTLLRVVLRMLSCMDIGNFSFEPADNPLLDYFNAARNTTGVDPLLPTQTSVLRDDMTVRCDSGLYLTFRPLGYIFAGFYIVGIPLLFFCISSAGRDGLNIGQGRVRIGGTYYQLVASRLKTISKWYGQSERWKLQYFDGPHGGIVPRLRKVFDHLYSLPDVSLDIVSDPGDRVKAGNLTARSGDASSAGEEDGGSTARRTIASWRENEMTPKSATLRASSSLGSARKNVVHNPPSAARTAVSLTRKDSGSRSEAATSREGGGSAQYFMDGEGSSVGFAETVSSLKPKRPMIFQDLHDLTFGLCPTTPEDYISSSHTIQTNLALSRLLEASYEEAVAIAHQHADLLCITTPSERAEDVFVFTKIGTWLPALHLKLVEKLPWLGCGVCVRGCGARRNPIEELMELVYPDGVPDEAPRFSPAHVVSNPLLMTKSPPIAAPASITSEQDPKAPASLAGSTGLVPPIDITQLPKRGNAWVEPQEDGNSIVGASARSSGGSILSGQGTNAGELAPPEMSLQALRETEAKVGRVDTDLLLALTLCLTAKKLEDVGRMQRRFGWLFVDYRPSAYMYEFWNLSQKAALVGAAVVLANRPGMLQCTVCILLLLLFLLNHQRMQPFVDICLLPKPVDPLMPIEEALDAPHVLTDQWRQGKQLSMGLTVHPSELAAERSPVSLGYIGAEQRRLMRFRSLLAILHLDEADGLRNSSFTPESCITPALPSYDAYRGAQVLRFAGVKGGAAKNAKGGAKATNEPSITSEDAHIAQLSYEDFLLLNPAMLRPWHIACCSQRAQRLSRSRSRMACACPWWTRMFSLLPDVLTTSWLDRIGQTVQLLCLVLLFIFEAQTSSSDTVDSKAKADTILSWVMLLNVSFTWLMLIVILTDLGRELRVMLSTVLSLQCLSRKPRKKLNARLEAAGAHTLGHRRKLLYSQLMDAGKAVGALPLRAVAQRSD